MKHFNMLCNGQKIRKKFEYKKKKKKHLKDFLWVKKNLQHYELLCSQ